MIYGIAVFPYYTGVTSSVYTVTATDSAGLTASTQLSVTVNTVNLLRISHELSMRIATDYQFFVSDIRHALWWAGNVTRVFGADIDRITMLGVDGSVILKWSNNTINSINPPYTCPLSAITENYNSLRSPEFSQSLNQYLIDSVTITLKGICEGFVITSTTTSTTIPTTTTSTTTTPTTTHTTTSTTPTTRTTTSELTLGLLDFCLHFVKLCNNFGTGLSPRASQGSHLSLLCSEELSQQ